MAFISTTSPCDATGEVAEMYERQFAHFGYLPNYARLFSHRPEVMRHWARLLAAIRSDIDPRRFELVTVAAAHALGNSYCALAHGKALTEHFTAQDVQRIAADDNGLPLSAAEAAMVKFARKVATNAAAVTAGDVGELEALGFSDAEVFDIVATVAARAFFTKFLDGLGAEADVNYLEMEPQLRKSLTVGRPIAFK